MKQGLGLAPLPRMGPVKAELEQPPIVIGGDHIDLHLQGLAPGARITPSIGAMSA